MAVHAHSACTCMADRQLAVAARADEPNTLS